MYEPEEKHFNSIQIFFIVLFTINTVPKLFYKEYYLKTQDKGVNGKKKLKCKLFLYLCHKKRETFKNYMQNCFQFQLRLSIE